MPDVKSIGRNQFIVIGIFLAIFSLGCVLAIVSDKSDPMAVLDKLIDLGKWLAGFLAGGSALIKGVQAIRGTNGDG